MSKRDIVHIITDLNQFQDRTDEIASNTSYDTVKHAVAQIKEALYDHPEVAAICAPQIGTKLRIFVVKTAKTEENRFRVFLNPMVISGEGLHLSRENNVSFPDKQFIIPRRNKVHVAYQTEDGHVTSETYFGAYGEVVQQMIEMLDGITLADYGLDLDDIGGAEVFDKAPKTQKEKVIELYLNNLKNISTDLHDEIEASPELKNLDDTINFMTGMLNGSITPIKNEEKN